MPDEPPALDYNKIYGGSGSDDVPWWLVGGRKIPNIASFKVPDYAVITNRIPRKAMLAVIGTFVGPNERRFAISTDARLVPTSKLKPERGSTFHGVNLKTGWHLPVAFVKLPDTKSYDLCPKGALGQEEKLRRSTPGSSRVDRSTRAVIACWRRGRRMGARACVAIAAKPSKLPAWAKAKKRWIDIAIHAQTWCSTKASAPWYCDRDPRRDLRPRRPKKTLSTRSAP